MPASVRHQERMSAPAALSPSTPSEGDVDVARAPDEGAVTPRAEEAERADFISHKHWSPTLARDLRAPTSPRREPETAQSEGSSELSQLRMGTLDESMAAGAGPGAAASALRYASPLGRVRADSNLPSPSLAPRLLMRAPSSASVASALGAHQACGRARMYPYTAALKVQGASRGVPRALACGQFLAMRYRPRVRPVRWQCRAGATRGAPTDAIWEQRSASRVARIRIASRVVGRGAR